MTYAVHGSAGLLLAGFLVACGPTPDPIPAPPPDEQPATPPQRPAERTATGNPGAVSVDRRFADDVSLHFPDRAGTASVRPIPYHPPGVDEIAMTVESSAPVVIGIRSGIFPVIPDAEYAVNFSDRPAIWLRADEKGTLAIPINPPPGEPLYAGLVISRLSGEDFLQGAAWTARADATPDPVFGGPPAPCGTTDRDESLRRAAAPSFRLQKTRYDGVVEWESAPARVEPGREYLLSGYYHCREAAPGSVVRFQVTLRGEGKPDRVVRDSRMSFFSAPTFGALWRYAMLRLHVPEGYETAAVQLRLEGAAQSIWWDELKLRAAPRPLHLVPPPLREEDRQPRLSVEEVRALWRDRPARTFHIENRSGLPQALSDGRPVSSLTYNHYTKAPEHVETRALLDAGLRWQFITPARHPKDWWTGNGQYDFSEVRSNIESVLQFDPNALIMLNVNLRPMFPAWGEDRPDAVWHTPEGRKVAGFKSTLHTPEKLPENTGRGQGWYASYAADGYRESAAEALRALLSHLKTFETGKAVAGIMLQGGNDNQWQRPFGHAYEGFDYSPGAQRDFRRYLRERYELDASLQQAWNDPVVTLETATYPTPVERDPDRWFLDPSSGSDRRVMDANAHADEGLARTLELFARTAKEVAGPSFQVFTYQHDMMEFGGRSSPDTLLRGSLSGLVSIPAYGAFRSVGAAGQISGALRSHSLHGRIHLHEFDVRTHAVFVGGVYREPPTLDAFQTLYITYGAALNEREFLHQARRDAAFACARGAGAWYLVMPETMFVPGALRSHVAEIARAFQRAADRPMPEDAAQMAVWSDSRMGLVTRDRYARTFQAHSIINPLRTAIQRSGVSFDPFYLSDLAHPLRPRYKAHLFLSAPTLGREQLDWIRENLQKDGNVLVFVNAAGKVSDAGPYEDVIRELTGMTARFDDKTSGVYRTVPLPSDDPFAAGLKDNVETLWTQPMFYIDDPEVVPVGRIAGTDKVGWAVKRFPDWTAVMISIAGNITPELIRSIIREAGLEPVGPNGDVTVAGNGFVAIHALSDGTKDLVFPAPVTLTDLGSGKTLPESARLSFPMQTGETRWFRKSR